MPMQIVLLVLGGVAGSCLFRFLHIPGGCMLGAVVGSMVVKLAGLADVQMPDLFYQGAQVALGICVGSMISFGVLATMKTQIPVMLISTGILLAAGLLAALVVGHMTNLDAISSVLSTSPGGLNTIIGLADHTEHLPQIVAFQMTRLYLVIFLVPAFCWVLSIFLHK